MLNVEQAKCIIEDVLQSCGERQSDINSVGSLPCGADVRKLIKHSRNIFKEEKIVLRVTGRVAIVGDLHGNIDDLLRILERVGYPPYMTYLFLGDYVDRGQHAVEVLLLLFSLKCLYPEHVFLLRGNHEQRCMTKNYGFKKECECKYSNKIYKRFCRCFAFLPIAAVVNDKILCVHGGISRDVESLDDIERIQRPIRNPSNDLRVDGVLWSDPRAGPNYFEENDRGTGDFFNEEALDEFLNDNELMLIIRAHENCQEGFDYPFGLNGKCITVFSSSNYCGNNNLGACAIVNEQGLESFETFRPIEPSNMALRRIIKPDWLISENTRFLAALTEDLICPFDDYITDLSYLIE